MKERIASSRSIVTFALAAALAVAMIGGAAVHQAYAAAADTPLTVSGASLSAQDEEGSITKGTLTVSGLEDFGGVSALVYEDSAQGVSISICDEAGATITVACADPALVVVPDEYASYYSDAGYYCYVYCDVTGVGKTTISVSNGADTIEVPIVAYPYSIAKLSSVSKASYNTVKLDWTPMAGVDGYEIKRGAPDYYWSGGEEYSTVASVEGGFTATATVLAPWEVEYGYYVAPYVEYAGSRFSGFDSYGNEVTYKLPKADVQIESVKKASSKGLKLVWSADAGASSYTVFRSIHENYGYKKIATTTKVSYTDKKAKKGTIYYYRIRATYPGCGSIDSRTLGQMITKSSKVAHKSVKLGSAFAEYGNYMNWTSTSSVLYYVQGSKLFAVCHVGSTLKVIGFNSKMKKVSIRTVKLPKFEYWGGMYHGPDGNNYVAVGYNNYKESKTKTVIKVIKYNSSWKKGKTAVIKGGASNSFEGIYSPFEAGTVSFDMQDSTLYLLTCRTMFKTDDGLHHQSNIAFSVNTKNMKAKEDNIAYTSHSFNQRVKFKDGTVYLADHGDAYDRGICLTWQDGYGTETASVKYEVPFPFLGGTGENYTGASMGGMEVGKKNILVCGTAKPHGFKIAGVKGYDYSLKSNVYVTVTDRETEKSSVKWLTSINPKKGKQTVGPARMVKLSDDRFAVIYSITSDKTEKSTVYYTVVNNEGKKLLTKKYSNVVFGGSQPKLMNGCIYWIDQPEYGKPVLYRIPAL